MNEMSKLIKHVCATPKNLFFECLFIYFLVSVNIVNMTKPGRLSHIHYVYKVPITVDGSFL